MPKDDDWIERGIIIAAIREARDEWQQVYDTAFARHGVDDIDTCRRSASMITAYNDTMRIVGGLITDDWDPDGTWDGTQGWVGKPVDPNPYHFVGLFTAWTPEGAMLFEAKSLDAEGKEPHFHIGDTLTIVHTLTAS